MAALQENSSTTQAARGATWMGAFWNKKEEGRGGKGMEKRGEKRRELKWNTWIWVGKWVLFLTEAAQADSLTCVHVTQCVWPAKRIDVIQTPNTLHCSIRTLTSQHGFPWAPSLFDGGRDEQIFLDKCPWTIHVAPLLLLDYLYLFHVSLLYYWLLLFLDLHLKLCFLQWGILWKEKAPSFYSRKGRFKESQRDYFRSPDYVSRFRMNVMYKLIRQKVEIYKTWKMSKSSILSTFYIHFPNNF